MSMLSIELQTLPAKGRPAMTYATFEIPANTTVSQFVTIVSEKAGSEFTFDGPNVVKGLRKFKLTGEPDQLIRDALVCEGSAAPDTSLLQDIGLRYVAELKGYVSLSNANPLSSQDGPFEWSVAGLSSEEADERSAYVNDDGSWDKQRLVDALLSGAASAGNEEGVRAALQRGAEVNSKPFLHMGTALHVALNADVTAILLDALADINAGDGPTGGLPLTRAIRFGRQDTAQLLIQRGAKLDFTRDDGAPESALRFVYFAAHTSRAQQAELARMLIAHGVDVNARDREGWSVLMEAALQGHTEIVRMLTEAGADTSLVAEGPNGWGSVSALDVARRNGCTAVAALLEPASMKAPSPVKVLHLVRHSQSNWNVTTAGEHVGQHPEVVDLDSRLSELGRKQAQALSWDAVQPPPELVLSSPLSRALETALALVGSREVEIRAEPLATEWCENSCDVGRSSAELLREFGGRVRGLDALDAQWWPLSAAEIAAGGRETEESVDERCTALLATLRALPQGAVAVVAHCMVLEKLQRLVGGNAGVSTAFLSNTEVRTLRL